MSVQAAQFDRSAVEEEAVRREFRLAKAKPAVEYSSCMPPIEQRNRHVVEVGFVDIPKKNIPRVKRDRLALFCLSVERRIVSFAFRFAAVRPAHGQP